VTPVRSHKACGIVTGTWRTVTREPGRPQAGPNSGCRQQLEQSPLVLVRLMLSLFHGLKLADRPGRVRLLALPFWGRCHERFPCPGVQSDSARSTGHQSVTMTRWACITAQLPTLRGFGR